MPNKKGIGMTLAMVLSFAGAIFLIVAGLQLVAGWDFGEWFSPIVMVLVGVGLILQGNFKLKIQKKQDITNIVHRLSAVFGSAVLILGIITLPMLAGTTVPVISTFAGWITLLSGAWFIVEAFVK